MHTSERLAAERACTAGGTSGSELEAHLGGYCD